MKLKDMFRISGFLIYIILTVIDKFIVNIADGIYIPCAILAIILLIIGFFIDKKGK